MIKPRTIVIVVCGGFILSFCMGLAAGVSFGIVLLRALIFAGLFGALSFGIGVVFQRFLLDGSDSDGGSEVPSGARQGSIVDLSVGDEPLVEDENGPDFYVRKEVAALGSEERGDGREGRPVVPPEAASHVGGGPESTARQGAGQEQFRPVSLGTPAGDAGGGVAAPGFAVGGPGESEDALPEISDIAVSSSDGDEFSSGVMDLAIGNGMETSQRRGGVAISADANTIAQAISTVLAQDS